MTNLRNMWLIADSGSTKTKWCIADEKNTYKTFLTSGINPYYQSAEEIENDFLLSLKPELGAFSVDKCFYYGAGCNTDANKAIISKAIQMILPEIEVEVYTDLMGAARALFLDQPGIACILGTGSNSCYYDGVEIRENVSPLGFILGDEGSGAVLGRLLVGDCLKNQLPEWLRDKFLDEYELTPALIMDQVYRKSFPNRFLAKFAPFMAEHLDEPIIFNQVYDSFDAFISRNVLQYNLEELLVGFSGSVAENFKDVLEIVAAERDIKLGPVFADPMPGLIEYHQLPVFR